MENKANKLGNWEEAAKEHSITEDDFADAIVRSNEAAVTRQLMLMHDDLVFTYDKESRANIESAAREIYQSIIRPLTSQIEELKKENEKFNNDIKTLMIEIAQLEAEKSELIHKTIAETTDKVRHLLINLHWSFSSQQIPKSSWQDKQDFLSEIEKLKK